MIHLAIADCFDRHADTLLFVGSLAPDCIDIRSIKDHTHFRDRTDREAALDELKSKTNFSDPFEEGILLHLFADLLWDRYAKRKYPECFGGDPDQFREYRRQIGLAGSHLYHSLPRYADVWEKMSRISPSEYSGSALFPSDKIHEYILTNKAWHEKPDPGESTFFPADFVKKFIEETVADYQIWRKQ